MSQHWVPTVNDLRVKLCYICREEERYDNPEEPQRQWTHPCNCTLIAHESCLLNWIKAAQQDPSRANNALKCPQCSAKYEIESDNPFILRMLDRINASLSVVGKVVTVTGMTGVVVSFGMGIYFIATSYGAYAVREFFGKEMYNLLLTDDPSNWPWHAFINLPLVPFSLVLSRTRIFDTLPIVPLFLAWPSSPPVQATYGIISSLGFLGRKEDLLAQRSLLTWPPPPIVVAILYPFVTSLYRLHYSRVKHWIMGTQPTPLPPLRQVIWAFNEDGPAPLRVRIGANIEPANDERQQPEAVAANDDEGQNAGDEQPDDPAAVAERTMRVTNASLGRFIGGALMMPAISNFMGAILYRLAKHSRWLHRFLAIRPPMSGRAVAPLHSWFLSQPWDKLSYVQRFSMSTRMALNLICSGTRVWTESDPVWWRNSIGLGLFVVAKDYIALLHLWLAKRELETRRVKNRSFEGVDMKELDLIPPAAV